MNLVLGACSLGPCALFFFLTSFEHELVVFVGLLATGIGP